jgi:transposase
MGKVVIGMDPHKRSATIEIMAGDEAVLGGGRFGTDAVGYRAMLAVARRWPERTWAVEGCKGIGGHIASRLLADGERVVDVPPKLSARARMFATGQGRKTDATGAHSVALVATRMSGLRKVADDQQLAVLRVLVDRRRSVLGDVPGISANARISCMCGCREPIGAACSAGISLARVRAGRPSADAAARISESEDLTVQVEQPRHLAAFHASHPAFCADTPFAWSGWRQPERSVDMS